jgi:hypothetical protein
MLASGTKLFTWRFCIMKNKDTVGHLCFTPIILATQEAEIRRITLQSQPRQMVHEDLYRKKNHKKRAGRVAGGVGPEFNPQYHKITHYY